ncbi:DUF3145 family protein [Epidermidibacterium keratini]|uniref:DUF3145 family protein n=1 Tax=Epidermidibacterium keratini TaxID=1891644 RepID=A0A7L4YIW5_9ACTN|nr:DUF3145 domain-containing protein [Epidermidibacterium keratini]QHB99284.1 DUF3145 family protein [Epidermidibacterium keratini]
MQTRGVVFIHSAPPALTPHAEWALSAALRTDVRIEWTAQPAAPGELRTELSWNGPSGTASAIASALKAWPTLVFEVTEDPTAGTDGERIAHLPGRGLFRAQTSVNGDIVISENQLRALCESARTAEDYQHGLDALLGTSVDAELEAFREGGDGAAVTWIHRAG